MYQTLRLEAPDQPDVIALLERATDYLLSLYPAESCDLLDAAGLAAAGVRFWVARQAEQAVGCCALVPLSPGTGEIKRLYVDEAARGQGLGKRLLDTLEGTARAEGMTALLLEAGIHQPQALGLYRKRGYVRRGPFGNHRDDPLSIFMQKPLGVPV